MIIGKTSWFQEDSVMPIMKQIKKFLDLLDYLLQIHGEPSDEEISELRDKINSISEIPAIISIDPAVLKSKERLFINQA